MAVRKIVSALLIAAAAVCASAQTGSNQTVNQPVKRVRADLSGFDLDKTKSAGTQVGGGSRGGPTSTVVLEAPRKGLAYTTHPLFQWHDSESAGEFVFRIFDGNGDELFETNLTQSRLQYPQDAPELKPGASYSWTVQHAGQSMLEPPLPAQISILPETERKQLAASLGNNDDLETGRKRAEVFVTKRLWYDAVEAYSGLIDRYPKSAELYRRRGDIYSQLPATESLAEQDFERAERIK